MSTAQAAATTEAPAEMPAEAAAPAAAEAPAKPAKKGMRFKYKLLLIITSLALMALLRTGFIFVVVAMMPAIITYYIDRSAHRFMFKTIFACNLSGLVPFLGHMLHEGPGGILLQEIIRNPGTWVILYGSAFAGYLLISVAPILAHFIIGNFHTGQVGRLERAQKKIESEWGEEVTKFSRTDDKH